MTPAEAKELLPMIQAYADGAQLQFRFRVREHFDDVWSDCPDDHSFAARFEYRIKPKAFVLGGREVEFRDDGSVRFSDGETLPKNEIADFIARWDSKSEAREQGEKEWPKYWTWLDPLMGPTVYRAKDKNCPGHYRLPNRRWSPCSGSHTMTEYAGRSNRFTPITPARAAEILGISINELTKP